MLTQIENFLFLFPRKKKKMSTQLFDLVINGIDKGFIDEKYFEEGTLFINIFYCFYFTKYLSPYYSWGEKIIKILKRNIRRKWVKCLPDVDFFIDRLERKFPEFDPLDYYYNSEDYFTKILFLKPISDILFPATEKKKKKKNNYKKHVLIR